MPYEPDDYLSRHFQTSGVDLASKIDELVTLSVPDTSPNLPLYREMLLTVIRMAQADRNRWDAKIMLQTLREMEHAFSRLEQFKRRRKVTVFGSARTPLEHPLYALARELGATLARYDMMVITGAGGGIMAAAHEGAGLNNSLGFNITLPFEQHANPTVDGTENLLSFHFFFVRKLFFVKEADALVLCPGGFGTLDEALEVLTLIQTSDAAVAGSSTVPVVGLRPYVPDHKVYFVGFDNKKPAYFLCGLLNTPIVREWIESHTVSIQMGDVFKHMNLPQYDDANAAHLKLSRLVEKCHEEHNAKKRALLVARAGEVGEDILARWMSQKT